MLPHVSNEIHDTVTVNGVTSRVQLPGATLDWAAVPRVELGYRLPDGFGEIALAYRFLGSQSSGTASGAFAAPDGPWKPAGAGRHPNGRSRFTPATSFPSAVGG